jgi:hypothetical protein
MNVGVSFTVSVYCFGGFVEDVRECSWWMEDVGCGLK